MLSQSGGEPTIATDAPAVADRSPAADRSSPPAKAASGGLPFGLTMGSLQELAGISALGSFVFAIAATISAAAYLSAWGIPSSIVSLNPLTALTKAGELIYTFVLVGLIWVVLSESHSRTKHHRGLLTIILVIVAVALIGLAFEAGIRGFFGATLASIATYLLFLGLRVFGRIPLAPTVFAMVVVVLLAAYQTGHEIGVKVQSTEADQTHLLLTLRAPIAGLPGAVVDGPAYKYDQLYLIFQDDLYVYVGSNVAKGNAYLVGIGQIVAMTVVH